MANPTVSLRAEDGLRWVTLDNPPVNALGHAVRVGLLDALREVAQDPDASAMILHCAGRTFSAGADISEFGQPPRAPLLDAVMRAIEQLGKPSIAALHGSAFGGGLELAMTCHYRVAASTTRLALPEVTLGLIPGAGGTQRTPRLIGPDKALELMLSGKPISADVAKAQGLVDEVVDEADLLGGVRAFAEAVVASGHTPPLVRDRDEKLRGWRDRLEWFAATRDKARSAEAKAAVDAVFAAAVSPFDEGLARERALALELIDSPGSVARRHAFFAERKASKIPGLDPAVQPADISHVAVIGGGQMGSGIATALLDAGLNAILVETSPERAEAARERIRANWANRVKRGALSEAEVEDRLARLKLSANFEDIRPAGLVIEAVWEDMALKKSVFQQITAVAASDAVLGTNTSTLDIDAIAATTTRPADVVGLHFFSPAQVMRLLEVVRGKATSDRCLVTALALARRLKKVPVVVGVCDGFVGNRIFAARDQQATRMLIEGASPADIDGALERFGFAMGTFTLYDMAGAIELGWRLRRQTGEVDEVADALYEAGRLGQRVGKGYYRYEPGNRAPLPDPEVERIIAAVRDKAGLTARHIPEAEIIERMIYPMINEAAKILDERVAQRASDIDVVWLTGYGWPIDKGGPAYYGDLLGLAHVRDRLEALQAAHGDHFAPSSLLVRLAESGGALGSVGDA